MGQRLGMPAVPVTVPCFMPASLGAEIASSTRSLDSPRSFGNRHGSSGRFANPDEDVRNRRPAGLAMRCMAFGWGTSGDTHREVLGVVHSVE
eukprot:ctg_466.g244